MYIFGQQCKTLITRNLSLSRLHLDHEKPFNPGPAAAAAATAEPDYINLAVLRKRLMSQPAGLSRFPNVIGYASTQRILELYGNPHTPLLPDSGKERQGRGSFGNESAREAENSLENLVSQSQSGFKEFCSAL